MVAILNEYALIAFTWIPRIDTSVQEQELVSRVNDWVGHRMIQRSMQLTSNNSVTISVEGMKWRESLALASESIHLS
jgi:hypothetical protein